MRKQIRLLGLMVALSYLIIFLLLWMGANYLGYTFFSAGEPVPAIKYTEWILGILAIIVVTGKLKEELDAA